jgi:hypothetical protein
MAEFPAALQKNHPKVGSKRFFVFCLFWLLALPLQAQIIGYLEFIGWTKKGSKPLPGATVTLYRSGVKQKEVITGKNGKFRFDIDWGYDYKITFSAPGHVDMHLLVIASNIPKDRQSMMPVYEVDVPFFETTDQTIRLDKYKKPFLKIVYDGNKAFRDDETYLEAFVKDIHVDPDEVLQKEKDRLEKERLEKERLLAIEKEKQEKLLALEKKRLEEEERLRSEELARLKKENEEKMKQNPGEVTMETEVIRLQREKEAKNALEKKNRGIKSTYESELLKTVAENERIAKEKELNKLRSEAQTNAVIEKIKTETEIKAKSDYLREQEKLKSKKTLENQQIKSQQVKKLVEAAAFADRSVKVNKQVRLPDPKEYKPKATPNVAVSIDEGLWSTVSTVTVTYNKKVTVFRKELYMWGSVYYYRNDVEIDEAAFKKEVAKYGPYTQSSVSK